MPKPRKENPELEKMIKSGAKDLLDIQRGHSCIQWGFIRFRN